MRQIYIVTATQVVTSQTHPEGVYSVLNGYPIYRDSRDYERTDINPNGNEELALIVAKADFADVVKQLSIAHNRAMWMVTLERADSPEGEIYATAAYEGQPVSFSLPAGFQYYVSVSDTLDHHFNPTAVRGIIKDANVAVTLQYSDLFSTIHTAPDIKTALNAGMDLTDLVGGQITCTKGSDTLTWDIVDYDDTNKSVKLLLHDCFGTENMVFEPLKH